MAWECGIDGCGEFFDDVESAIVHQAEEHERLECEVCGTIVPDGFLAIHHAFTDHTRAEYVRAYGASAEEVREREELLDAVRSVVDQSDLAEQLTVRG